MKLTRLTLLATAAAATAVAIKLLADRVPRVRRMQLMLTRHAEPKTVEAPAPAAAAAAKGGRKRAAPTTAAAAGKKAKPRRRPAKRRPSTRDQAD